VDRIILGISEGFGRPRGLAAAYRQSKVAAQAAAVDPQLGELVDCRAAGVYQLLASAGGGASAWADSGSVYYRMLEDHDRNGELLPVLELLYDNDGSVQDVATRLHLHRSSIYNRLGRIRQLLGVDPLKGMPRLELHSALKMRRWAGRPRI
jgi:DNA-binding PucR family transcriptional regulator